MVFPTNAQRRHSRKKHEVGVLLGELPASWLAGSMGARAEAQVPSARRRAAMMAVLMAKAGPEGEMAHKAVRFLRSLRAVLVERHIQEDGLRVSAALAADVVAAEAAEGRRRAQGSRKGATVGGSFREGAVYLQKCGMPVDADNLLVQTAAEGWGLAPDDEDDMPAPTRHAASLRLAIQCQLETLAAASEWSVARTFSRALLVSCFVHHIRLNDALNAVIEPDRFEPDRIIYGRAKLKARKKTRAIELFAPAEGWLGPFAWLSEHLEEMAGRKHALPAFSGGRAGRPSEATELGPGVCSKSHARMALVDLCAMAPLCMSPEEFKAMGFTTHSPHGTGTDMMRYMGELAGFSQSDRRRIGHWLADPKAAAEDAPHHRVRVVGGGRDVQGKGVAGQRSAMPNHYSQGVGRGGERMEQVGVRARFVAVVRRAIAAAGCHWTELPMVDGLDWSVLPHDPGGRFWEEMPEFADVGEPEGGLDAVCE